VSKRLHTDAIYYCVSDTCGRIGYDLIQKGRFVEQFEAEGGGEYKFRRERRPGAGRRIQDGWSWPYEFFREQNAFEPGFDFGYFIDYQRPQPGERAVVRNPGRTMVFSAGREAVSRPGLERVDYVVLK
jgi:hypothetical protein